MFPGFNPNLDSFEEEMLADWSEDQKKEREVILGNRYAVDQCNSQGVGTFKTYDQGFPLNLQNLVATFQSNC